MSTGRFAGLRTFQGETGELLRWWIHELRDMAEDLWSRWAPKAATRVILQFDSGNCLLWQRKGRSVVPLGEVQCGPTDVWPEAQILKRMAGARAHIALRSDRVLVRELSLPLSARREMANIVRLYLERELPLPLARFYFTHRELPRAWGEPTVRVQIIITRRDVIDGLLGTAKAWGLRPVVAGVAVGTTGIAGNVLAVQAARWRPTTLSVVDRRLLQAGAVLGVLCALTVGVQNWRERVVVSRELAKVSELALSVSGKADALSRRVVPAQALARIVAAGDAADVLAELSERVPRDSWAYELSIDAPHSSVATVKMTGFAVTSAGLLEALQHAPRLTEVTLLNAMPEGPALTRVQVSAKAQTAAIRGTISSGADRSLAQGKGA